MRFSLSPRWMGVRSMRVRMTGLFALFVALLMLASGAAVARREARRAERRTSEILQVALERAQAEMQEADEDKVSLLQAVQSDAAEISAGGLILMVATSDDVLWKSRQHAPSWPDVGDHWRYRTLARDGQILILAHDWETVEEELQETTLTLWALGVLVVLSTTLGAWLVVGKTLSPLEKLAAQAQNASIEAPQVRLESPSSDAEMRHLTTTLNDLLSRLEKESQARGRFYAAASHELRTPIQALLGQVDVAQSRPRTLEQHETILAQLGHEVERLAALTQDLLQLNALEMRQNQAPPERLDLKQWVERALWEQNAAIEERNLHLETFLQPCEILAPSAHLSMLLRNLLENAVKYATAGTVLELKMECLPEGARLTIWNACKLASQEDLSSWFEPFFRPDSSRNSQTGGNGLGLSVVASLARANGWKVALKPQNGGVLVEVSIAD